MIQMMRPCDPAGNESRGKCAECHGRVDLDQVVSPGVDLLFELRFDAFGLPAVRRFRRRLMTNSIHIKVGPPDLATLKQAHNVAYPPCCCFSIQRTTWAS